ncbi:MAG: monovalent cation/H(+) antiporter subunit G [Arenicellales bacterium]|jgi:multicomponent Na+:H+ antiporter subunit G|nr:sodium:proton antiporter [Acidiferrobacteraceae bacterium]MDP6289679.1 monovalent cation/H(+) antiporter subunit G [Arenicellales bacterium]MDP6434547.1 monovalent cation/H(+) antiporter subunit G [Arenicellales bacterium]MDP6672702.1 monovalent cation/H(+) antiporter subunit G [Arenicellales bacterium]MDP6724284.1 monovalent cation/H(+) antiporter subunit G [Arenicellales bacterium]|tara:strand:- start:2560 stop:2889 length:330 start_codon:yes stop_codon:yes gene_type:complete
MVQWLVDLLSWAALLGGALFLVGSGIGLLRFPDFYTRLHAAGLADTLGTALTLLGLGLQAGFTQPSVKLAMILIFIWLTSPTSTHALAKSALHSGLKPSSTPSSGGKSS